MQMGIGVITGKASEYYYSAKKSARSIYSINYSDLCI